MQGRFGFVMRDLARPRRLVAPAPEAAHEGADVGLGRAVQDGMAAGEDAVLALEAVDDPD